MRYVCSVCGYVYDERKEGAAFADLPDNWKCPLCGAAKSAFKAETQTETEEGAREIPAIPVLEEDIQQFSAGQLAALFSNLARGCEKQYKPEEASWFQEIAEYYTAAAPSSGGSGIAGLEKLLETDIAENYLYAKSTAQSCKDRGAQRICVWGEKVTQMLLALTRQYRKEGEAMLAKTQVWMCTVCGFVYIGDTPPQLCPVCKVPEWKFEKIEGRRTA